MTTARLIAIKRDLLAALEAEMDEVHDQRAHLLAELERLSKRRDQLLNEVAVLRAQ